MRAVGKRTFVGPILFSENRYRWQRYTSICTIGWNTSCFIFICLFLSSFEYQPSIWSFEPLVCCEVHLSIEALEDD